MPTSAGPGPPVRVLDWWDVFTFTDAVQIECPDCDLISPEFENIYKAARWVESHYRECPA